jgi:pimeloyl-ACP methyl ester carboxylesterase
VKRRRYLAYSFGALAAGAAAGRLVTRRDRRREDPAAKEHLGSIRGHPREIRGPRASRLYTEWFPSAEGAAGTLLFTHGYCLTEAVWHYQKRDLTGGPLSLATWDLPGHGHSPPTPAGRLTLEFAADALARVVDEYGDRDLVLVGHSLGGVVTLRYLALHPQTVRERVRAVVLASTPMMHFARSTAGRWPGASVESRVLGRLLEYVVESDLAERYLGQDVGHEEIGRLSYRLVRWGFGREPSPTQVRFIRDVIASVPPQVRADTFKVMTGYDVTPVLPTLDIPVLVVIGGRDRLVNPEESSAMARRLPRGELLTLPESGHASFLEEHARFNQELLRFARPHLGPGELPRSEGARVEP